jgi:transcriptional regulator with XRE-family HTH domain
MKEVNSRIMAIRAHLGLSQSKFAQRIGVTSQLINKIEANKAKLTEVNIHVICLTFGVREEWLREGKGEMMDEEAQLSDYEKRLLKLFRRLSPSAQEAFIEYVEKLVALATNEAVLCGEALKALKQAPGGTTRPLEAPQEAEREESTRKEANPIHHKKRG